MAFYGFGSKAVEISAGRRMLCDAPPAPLGSIPKEIVPHAYHVILIGRSTKARSCSPEICNKAARPRKKNMQ